MFNSNNKKNEEKKNTNNKSNLNKNKIKIKNKNKFLKKNAFDILSNSSVNLSNNYESYDIDYNDYY